MRVVSWTKARARRGPLRWAGLPTSSALLASAALVASGLWVGCGGESGGAGGDAAADTGESPDSTDTQSPADTAGGDSASDGSADSGGGGGIAWDQIPAEDRIAVALRVPDLGPAYDVAWASDGRALHCGRQGITMVEAPKGEAAGGEATAVADSEHCARIVRTAEATLVTTSEGAVLELDGGAVSSVAPAGAHAVRAALKAQGEVFAASEGSGLLHWENGDWSPVGEAFDGYDIAFVERGGAPGLLLTTPEGVRWYTLQAGAASFDSALAIVGGAWRVGAYDGSSVAAPLVVAAPRGLVELSTSGPLSAIGETPIRVAPVDAAPLGACALATGWTDVTRAICGPAKVPLDSESLRPVGPSALPVDHISSVATTEAGAVVVGTRQGLAVLTVDPEPADAPEAFVPRGSVQFGTGALGEPETVGVRLANYGTQPLLVASATVDDPRFTVAINELFAGDLDAYEPRPVLVVEARSVPGFFEVVYTADSTELVTTELVLVTNDPDESEIRIPIVANRPNPAVGDRATSVFLPDTRGRFSELSSFLDRVTYFKLFNST